MKTLKPVFVLTILGCLALASNAEASDYETTQVIDSGYSRMTVLNLPAGHSRFEVSGDGPFSCVMVAPKLSDLNNFDFPRARSLGGQLAVQKKCVIDLLLKRPTVVLLLVQNDDYEEEGEHSYYIHGEH
jgi:hypothetical protein